MSKYKNFTPQDFDKIDDSKMTEFEIQIALICYYRKFIKPRFPNSILLVNPFPEFIKKALYTFLGKGQKKLIDKITVMVINGCKSMGYNSKNPDVIIIQKSRKIVSKFNGLALEIKKLNTPSSAMLTKHCKEQSKALDNLRSQGYLASFSFGFKQSFLILKSYFEHNLHD